MLTRVTSKTKSDKVTAERNESVFTGEALFCSAIVVVCAIAFFITLNFDRVPDLLVRGMAPTTFPQGVIVFIGTLTMAYLVLLLVKPHEHTSKKKIGNVFYITSAASLVFLLIASYVDILLAMSGFVLFVTWLWGERRKYVLAILTIVSPVILFMVFSEFLGVRFPRGLIVSLLYG